MLKQTASTRLSYNLEIDIFNLICKCIKDFTFLDKLFIYYSFSVWIHVLGPMSKM